jgi:hypothetical protein
MPQFLEARLRKNVPAGVNPDHYVYGAMNNMGAMRGNKETAKGKRMQKKHNADKHRAGGGQMRKLSDLS